MYQYQYDVCQWPWKGLPANGTELTKRGQNGWELVGFYTELIGSYREPDEEAQVVAVFKRPVSMR